MVSPVGVVVTLEATRVEAWGGGWTRGGAGTIVFINCKRFGVPKTDLDGAFGIDFRLLGAASFTDVACSSAPGEATSVVDFGPFCVCVADFLGRTRFAVVSGLVVGLIDFIGYSFSDN